MGTFIESNLTPGEKIIYKTTVHWFIYLPGFAMMFAAIALFFLGKYQWGISQPFLVVLNSALLLVGFVQWVRAYLHRHFTEIAITDSRLIAKFGFIRRNIIELPLAKIESVIVEQGIFERIINAGSVGARGTGMAMAPVSYIDSPIEFRNQLNAAIASAKST